jgi:hypothetical protein
VYRRLILKPLSPACSAHAQSDLSLSMKNVVEISGSELGARSMDRAGQLEKLYNEDVT